VKMTLDVQKIKYHHATRHNDTWHNDTWHNDTWHNDTWHNDTWHEINIAALNKNNTILIATLIIQCHFAEWYQVKMILLVQKKLCNDVLTFYIKTLAIMSFSIK
jgi:hypothetical protein